MEVRVGTKSAAATTKLPAAHFKIQVLMLFIKPWFLKVTDFYTLTVFTILGKPLLHV